MEKVKNDLQKALSKHELLEALEESYKIEEQMYDENLERMAQLHEQIELLKLGNQRINARMKQIADKIREVAAK